MNNKFEVASNWNIHIGFAQEDLDKLILLNRTLVSEGIEWFSKALDMEGKFVALNFWGHIVSPVLPILKRSTSLIKNITTGLANVEKMKNGEAPGILW